MWLQSRMKVRKCGDRYTYCNGRCAECFVTLSTTTYASTDKDRNMKPCEVTLPTVNNEEENINQGEKNA